MVVPEHIALVMDGNGRWAQQRGLPRSAGHKAGFEHIPDVLEICYTLGVKVVSGYLWSTENWNRDQAEVDFVMRSLEQHLLRFVDELHQRNVRFIHSGRREQLSLAALASIDAAVALTRNNRAFVFNFAFNYGGRAELVEAARKLLQKGRGSEDISEMAFDAELWTAGLPDVNLIIRTGGDQRLSNFLLWQGARACFYVVDDYWPSVTKTHIVDSIKYYNQIYHKQLPIDN
jgi:undecaprenyl diphosphate synthase